MTHKFPQMQWKSPQRIVALTGPTQLIIGFSLAIAKSASVFIGLCVMCIPYLHHLSEEKGPYFISRYGNFCHPKWHQIHYLTWGEWWKTFHWLLGSTKLPRDFRKNKKVLQPSENKVSYLNANPFVNLETGIHFNFKLIWS